MSTSNSNPTSPPPDVISIVERSCSVFSLLGCVFIISTFCLDRAFRKPINRLVFYASFGNLMTNVATLMARAFIGDENAAGCQFQAFLIQMFMPADALWTLAMALNVYLTFYHKFDAQRLRKMDVIYLVACYGIPFVIALTYVFISSPERGRFYGNATLWCWVSPRWDIMRIATFYGPVWIVIVITFFIYIRAGSDIYKKQKQLRDFSSTTHHDTEPAVKSSVGDSFTSSKTTEVFVTTEVVDKDALNLGPLGGPSAGIRRGSQSTDAPKPPSAAAYSVTISSNRRPIDRQSYGDVGLPIQGGAAVDPHPTANRTGTTGTGTYNPRRRAAYEANSAILSYTKCALLFFTAMLVTWIPSSANRVFSVVHNGSTSTTLEIMSAAVLPLQGVWNAIIYTVTSWKAVKMLFNGQSGGNGNGVFRSWSNRRGEQRGGRRGGAGPKVQELVGVRPFQLMTGGRTGGRLPTEKPYNYESESMTELARSRPSSNDEDSIGRSSPREAEYSRNRT